MDFAETLARLRTPNKHGKLVLKPSFEEGAYDSRGVDCPFLFRHNSRYYMAHIGFDGKGYRTGLASSEDLLNWRKEGMILDRGPKGSPTEYNAALTWILRENELFGRGKLKRVGGRFLGTYHAYPAPGYEAGPASIGLCWSEDLRTWAVEEPFLHARDGGEWECGGLYKSCIVEHEGTFYMFYNAKTVDGVEQIGVATSPDLVEWTRHPGNPILTVGPASSVDDRFVSDPCVLKCDDTWVMFYYTLSTVDYHARDSVAFSSDLLNWEKSGEILVDVGPENAIDAKYAHKPGVIAHDGTLYHFYCAVGPAVDDSTGEIVNGHVRGIAVATS